MQPFVVRAASVQLRPAATFETTGQWSRPLSKRWRPAISRSSTQRSCMKSTMPCKNVSHVCASFRKLRWNPRAALGKGTEHHADW